MSLVMMLIKYTILLLCTVSSIYGQTSPDLNISFQTVCQQVEAIDTRRIVGGEDAYPGDFRHVASLQKKNGDDWDHFCGGSIVARRAILTAAHCIVNKEPNRMQVAIGSATLNPQYRTHRVKRLIPHRRFRVHPTQYDIGLIILEMEIEFDERVAYIKLPHYNTEPNTQLVVSGWGKISNNANAVIQNHLQQVQVQAISKLTCEKKFRRKKIIFDQQICTFSVRKVGVCVGDSGGPLADSESVVGVVSWGRPCAVWRPDVYTRVYHFVNWINKHLRAENISLPLESAFYV